MTYDRIREFAKAAALETERRLFADELERNGWNLTKTAEAIECPLSTLRRALEKHPDLLAQIGGRGRPKKQP